MQLKRIKIQNYKSIKELTHTFENGNIFVIKGDNEKGKTTFGRAFQKLITKMDKVEVPVTQGEDHGLIEGRFEDDEGNLFTVVLDFTNDKETIRMISPQGISTQKIGEIRNFFNYTNIDVEDFVAWSSTADGRRKQREIVLNLLDSEIRNEFDRLDTLEKKAYETRTDVNRDLKHYEAIKEKAILSEQDKATIEAADEIEKSYRKLKEQYDNSEKNASTKERLEIGITNAEERAGSITASLARRASYQIDYEKEINAEIKSLEEQINRKRLALETKKKENRELANQSEQEVKSFLEEADKLQTQLNKLPGSNTADIEDEYFQAKNAFEQIEEINKQVKDLKKITNEIDTVQANANHWTNVIETSRKAKKEVIASQNLPVKGLSIEEEGITLNGLPFTKEQLSTSQILTTVFHIMVAMNKKTPIFYLGRVESLGKAKLDDIVSIAEKEGYQLFIDKVESGEELTIEIYEDIK